MPEKLTLEKIQNFIDKYDINDECLLLATEYKNVNTPLEFYCNLCGDIFTRDFQHLRQRKIFCCQKCSRQKAGAKKAMGIDKIKAFLEEKDTKKECTLLSEFYKNEKTPLLFRCNKCGKTFERDWSHLKRNRFQCPKCGVHQGAVHKKYTKEDVEKDISKDGFIMIGTYVDASTPFEVICKNGHTTNLVYSQYKCGHSSCRECGILKNSGENHWNWKGGSTEIRDYLRKSIKAWKRNVLIRDNFCCALTGVHNSNLVVHHLLSYNVLLQQAALNTGIQILSKFSDYKNQEYLILKEELIRLHTLDNGITLLRPVHDLFHSLYGKGNNTKEQFELFSIRYVNGEFKDILNGDDLNGEETG